MSGPKTSSYAVVDNRIITEKAIADARVEYSHILSLLKNELNRSAQMTIEYELQGYQVERESFTDMPNDVSLDDARSHVNKLQGKLRYYEQVIANEERRCKQEQQEWMNELERLATAQQQAVMSGLKNTAGKIVTAADTVVLGGIDDTTNLIRSQSIVDFKVKVAEMVDNISCEITRSQLEELNQLATRIVESTSSTQVELTYNTLGRMIASIVRDAKLTAKRRDEVEQLQQSLWGLPGHEVEQINLQLELIKQIGSELTPQLRKEIARVEEQAKRRADQFYTAQVVHESLRELGYDVDEEFDTLFVEGGSTILSSSSGQTRDYGVRMKVDSESNTVNFNLVRFEQGDGSRDEKHRDRNAELSWCKDHDELIDQVSQKGVRMNCFRHIEPGVVQIPVAKSGRDSLSITKAKKKTKLKKKSRVNRTR